ncbi:MAG: hypothetical protein ACMUIE_05705, partial [Thermoplasmatota archaeon]
MKYGDKDGFKDIYDESGELILHPSEKKLVVEDNVVPTLKSTWRYYGGEYLLEPSKGTVILTNERMVFINTPERMFAIGGGEEARAMSSSMGRSFELGDAAPEATMREYFEIPNIEIMASERKEGAVSAGVMVNVFILSSGNQFHLSMVLESDSDLLKRLMNKRVESLDELVNNLKEYFRKTEWMFTDAELKFFSGSGKELPAAKPAPVKKEKTPSVPALPSHEPSETVGARTFNQPLPKLSGRIGDQSMKYFETLFRKGLIKEEIYNRLATQYGGPSSQSVMSRASIRPEAVPAPEEDGEPGEEGPAGAGDEGKGNDEELLNLLDETL